MSVSGRRPVSVPWLRLLPAKIRKKLIKNSFETNSGPRQIKPHPSNFTERYKFNFTINKYIVSVTARINGVKVQAQ